MPMPNRNIQDANGYRYAYQGQEKDPETGKEAFELRLWDGRIGRWLTTDPYGQYHSPYLGMGNNPMNGIDADGGCWDENGNPCADGNIGDIGGVNNDWTFTENGWDLTDQSNLVTITTSLSGNNANAYLGLALTGIENFGGTVDFPKIDLSSSPRFSNFASSGTINFSKTAKMAGNTITLGQLGYDVIKVGITEGQEQKVALNNLKKDGTYAVIGYYYPAIGVGITVIEIMATTDEYKNAVHQAKKAQIQKKLDEGRWNVVDLPDKIYFSQHQGSRKCRTCPITYN